MTVMRRGADWEQCRVCESYHPPGFNGDCREDENRLPTYPHSLGTVYDGKEIVDVIGWDSTDQDFPYLYLLSDGSTVWIPTEVSP